MVEACSLLGWCSWASAGAGLDPAAGKRGGALVHCWPRLAVGLMGLDHSLSPFSLRLTVHRVHPGSSLPFPSLLPLSHGA